MDEKKFWEVVQAAHDVHPGDMDRKSDLLKEALAQLPESEAVRFLEIFDERMANAR